jgi:hypothetical protein
MVELAGREVEITPEIMQRAEEALAQGSSENLWEDETFVLGILPAIPTAFELLPPAIKSRPAVMVAAFIGYENGGLCVPAEIQNYCDGNTQVLAHIVAAEPTRYFSLGDEIRRKPQNALTLLAALGDQGDSEFVLQRVMEEIDPALLQDANFMLQAGRADARALAYAAPALLSDEGFMLEAMQIDTGVLDNSPLARDWDFGLEACVQNRRAYYHVAAELRDDPEWALAAIRLIVGEEDFGIYRRAYEDYDIKFPQRFTNADDLLAVMENRDALLVADARPTALLFYTRHDYNGAFEKNQIQELNQRGYRVLYYEVETMDEIAAILPEVNPAAQKILMVIGGHGTQNSIALGAEGGLDNNNLAYFIDFSDEAQLSDLSGYIGEGSVIVYESCSTGAGGGGADNIVNMSDRAFPQAMSIGPPVPTSVDAYVYDNDNWVIDVLYADAGVDPYIPNRVIP